MTIYQGWTTTETKFCIRCQSELECVLYALCDDCRNEDETADEQERRDNLATAHLARYGY